MTRFIRAVHGILDGGLTQKQLAEEAGISRALLNKILKEEAGVTPNTVGRLCSAVDQTTALCFLKAYLADVSAEVWGAQATGNTVREKLLREHPVSFTITYPPSAA